MSKVPVKVLATPAKKDVDPDAELDVKEVDSAIVRCIGNVTDALKRDSEHLSPDQRQHIIQIFHSMGHAHRAVRKLLQGADSDPNPCKFDGASEGLTVAACSRNSISLVSLTHTERTIA